MQPKLQITQQINENDCGVCVIHALVNHFHQREIPFSEIATSGVYDKEGLSVYDLEILGSKYGLSLESFNATTDELQRIDEKHLVILVLKHDNLTHYVIARNQKAKGAYTIYCSVKGEYQLSYRDLSQQWCNIIIGCQKSVLQYSEGIGHSQFFKFNWKWFIIMNLINVFVTVLNLFCGTLMQNIMRMISNDVLFSSVFAIIMTYLLAYLSQYLISWIINLVAKKYCYQYYQLVHNEVLQKLSHKYHSFFQKVDYKYLIDCDELIFYLANFYIVQLNQFVAKALLVIGIVLVISMINVYVIAIALTCIVLIVICDFARYRFQQANWNVSQTEVNEYKHAFIKYLDFLKSHLFAKQQKVMHYQVISAQTKIKYRYFKNAHFDNFSGFIEAVIQVVLLLGLIMVLLYLVQMQVIDVSKLMLCTSLIAMLTTSTKALCEIPSTWVQVAHAKQIVTNILEIDNLTPTEMCTELEHLKEITYNDHKLYNDTIICGRSGVGKTYLLKQIANMVCDSQNALAFNEINKQQISTTWFSNNCIYLNHEPCLPDNLFQELFLLPNKQLVIQVLNHLNITTDKFEQLSSGQRQVLSFLQLLDCKNKVILLDEALSNVDDVAKELVLNVIKPYILANNFIVYVDHNTECHKYFTHRVVLDE